MFADVYKLRIIPLWYSIKSVNDVTMYPDSLFFSPTWLFYIYDNASSQGCPRRRGVTSLEALNYFVAFLYRPVIPSRMFYRSCTIYYTIFLGQRVVNHFLPSVGIDAGDILIRKTSDAQIPTMLYFGSSKLLNWR